MKTRIIYTEKLWCNKEFHKLSIKSALLAIYLVTNSNIGLIPIYEIKDLRIMFDLQLSENELEKCKKELQSFNLYDFYNEWVFVKNDFSYIEYFGRDILMTAKTKEENKIPREVTDIFKGLTRGKQGVENPLINNNIKIINNNINNNNNNKYINYESITEEDINEISEKYQVPEAFVRSKLDDVKNWEEEKPGRMKGRNWRATLMNWVKRDMLLIKQNYGKQNSEVSI